MTRPGEGPGIVEDEHPHEILDKDDQYADEHGVREDTSGTRPEDMLGTPTEEEAVSGAPAGLAEADPRVEDAESSEAADQTPVVPDPREELAASGRPGEDAQVEITTEVEPAEHKVETGRFDDPSRAEGEQAEFDPAAPPHAEPTTEWVGPAADEAEGERLEATGPFFGSEAEPEAEQTSADAQHLPGEIAEAAASGLLPAEEAQLLHERWQSAQFGFIDDPRAAAEACGGIAADAVQTVTAALARRQHELDSWRDNATADTEAMRMAVRGYRELLDTLLGN